MNCGCRNSENCKCAPVLDIGDLRDRIKKLKVQKAELQQTVDNLTKEIESKSLKLREVRHHRLEVDPDPDLRLRLTDTASVIGDTHDIDDQRFRIANEKIEMQILMHEIRQALPQLEREVRWREAIAAKGKRSTAKLSKAVEKSQSMMPTIWCASDELKQSVKDAMDLAISSKTARSTIIEEEKKKNAELSEAVSLKRKELARLMRERDHLRDGISLIDQQWRTEKFRQQLLREEHITQRNAIKRFHGGFGFQTEAFLKETGGDTKATLSLQRTAAALRPWLLPLDEHALKESLPDPQASWLTEDILLSQLQLMQRGVTASAQPASANMHTSSSKPSRASLATLDAFRYFDENEGEEMKNIDSIENNEEDKDMQNEEDKQTNDVNVSNNIPKENLDEPKVDLKIEVNRNMQIDLKTFCLLCDRLVIVYDA